MGLRPLSASGHGGLGLEELHWWAGGGLSKRTTRAAPHCIHGRGRGGQGARGPEAWGWGAAPLPRRWFWPLLFLSQPYILTSERSQSDQ